LRSVGEPRRNGSLPMCDLCTRYAQVRAADVAVAKALGVSEVAQIARLEGRLRRQLLELWERQARKAATLGGKLAGQGKTAAQIEAGVGKEMQRWETEALPLMRDAVEEIYRLARVAGWRKATGQTRASLSYSTPSLAEVQKRKPPRGFSVKPAFGVVDQDAIAALQKQQAFWVGEHYSNNVASAIRNGAREALVEAGESRRVAARTVYRRLRDELGQVSTPKGWNGSAAQYFEGLAANAATVGRAHGQMVSFEETGFTQYTIVNPEDERTCPVCSDMNGRTFTVAQGRQTMDAVLAADSPEGVKTAHPWKDPETGKRMTADGVGRIAPDRSAKSSEALSKAGFNVPPFHFKCRCAVDVEPGGPPAVAPTPVPPTPELPKRPRAVFPGAPLPKFAETPTKPFSKRRMATAMRKREGAYIPPEAQTEIRRELNALIAAEGVPITDLAAAQKFRGQLVLMPKELLPDALGVHNWDGGIAIRHDTFDNALGYLKGGKSIPQAKGMTTMVHEALHGASPISSNAYRGVGAFVEEVTTETVALAILRKQLGFTAEQVFMIGEQGYYHPWRQATMKALQSAAKKLVPNAVEISTREADELLELLSFSFKRSTETFASEVSAVNAFTEGVEWPARLFEGLSKAQAAELKTNLEVAFRQQLRENAKFYSK
jgi:hypothetical protein